ncbi:putative clathrin assembly protein At4g40080 [Malania oleifera]|uniref:putative clathrin assembly protein At4g40080 n=1 Tax=Malania oleifera TaxID=397392 RepID=UPI0025AE1D6D|nr:putative clathrin assembly protein At4g40080 [Malania oleifera]
MGVRTLIGSLKDKAALSRAALLSKPNTVALRLAVLRATTHCPSSPPRPSHLAALLSSGHSSRATASALIAALMDRLHATSDASVALKCLITVHHIIARGSFILQDQLSIFPTTGGRNYLKLSAFRDGTTPASWHLSAWVRWYAAYLERLLSASRVLGFFLCSSSSAENIEIEEERVSGLTNGVLIKEIDSVVGLLEEFQKLPDSLHLNENKLVAEVKELVGRDFLSAINELAPRVGEERERLSCLSFGESVELVCALKRLEDCEERLSELFLKKKGSTEGFWVMAREMKDAAGKVKACREEGWLGMGGRRESESARFEDRVLKWGNSVRFSSARLDLN